MSGLQKLIEFAERRVDRAASAWQRLSTQRDEAKQKLLMLKQHGDSYRDLMESSLKQGMSVTSTMAYMGFIGQIEAVVVRQEGELGTLEEACARLWQELVDARREKRMYEILRERAATREAEAQSRRGQAAIDELVQRAVKIPRNDILGDQT
jgi:flagellar FliJ protein